jgi:hypothetical protein
VVLIDADAIESEFVRVDELIEVAVVHLLADLRIEELIGTGDPGRPVIVFWK